MEQNKKLKFFDPYIKMMSTTNGRDKSLRFIQYLFMYLRGPRTKQNSNNLRAKIHYTCWITRKVLRLGLPIFILKKIFWRFKSFMRDAETQSKDKSTNNESQSDGSENMNFNDDVIFNNQPREGQELKLIKLDETLERSSIYGLAGHESRMMLTKTVKDLAFIVFLLVDMPLYFKEIKVFNLAEKTFQKLRKIQYISWLVQ